MENPTPQIQNYKTQIGEEIKRISTIIPAQFGDMMKNIQWYATLVVAEIAGIAKLTSLSQGSTFTFFLISIILLFIAIIALVYANIRAQEIKFNLEAGLAKLVAELDDEDFSKSGSNEVKGLKDIIKDIYDVAGKSDTQIISRFDLFAFLFGTIFGGIGILIS